MCRHFRLPKPILVYPLINFQLEFQIGPVTSSYYVNVHYSVQSSFLASIKKRTCHLPIASRLLTLRISKMCPNWANWKVLDLDSGQKLLTDSAAQQIQQALRLIYICHSGSIAAHLLRRPSTKHRGEGLLMLLTHLVPCTKCPTCGRTTSRHITHLCIYIYT